MAAGLTLGRRSSQVRRHDLCLRCRDHSRLRRSELETYATVYAVLYVP